MTGSSHFSWECIAGFHAGTLTSQESPQCQACEDNRLSWEWWLTTGNSKPSHRDPGSLDLWHGFLTCVFKQFTAVAKEPFFFSCQVCKALCNLPLRTLCLSTHLLQVYHPLLKNIHGRLNDSESWPAILESKCPCRWTTIVKLKCFKMNLLLPHFTTSSSRSLSLNRSVTSSDVFVLCSRAEAPVPKIS